MAKTNVNSLQTDGDVVLVGAETVTVLHYDPEGNILRAQGATVPTDATAGYAKGSSFVKTNGGVATTLYLNEGSATSCDFNAVESSSSTVTGVTAGNGITGGGTEGSVTVNVGMTIYNDTGSTITKGQLLRVKGYTSTTGITVVLADADSNIPATHVATADILNAASGTVFPVARVTGLATNGTTIGDAVYLSGTVGGFTFVAPTGANQLQQVVGAVKVVHASTGEIEFFPGTAQFLKVGTDFVQDLAVSTGKIAASAVTYAKIQNVAATDRLLGRSTAGAGAVEEITVAGDMTQSGSTFTIAAGAVTNAKVADSAGVGALGIRKSATVLYDFSVVGGAQGTIALTGSPTIPDNAVVWVESYDVLTTLTSGGGDAATVALQLPTDGPLSTAVAISDGTNPWDAGAFSRIAGGLATPLTVKTTAARVPSLLVAGGQDLTAGKIVFQLAYWVSQ